MRSNRKMIVGMAVAAALAASSGYMYAQPAGSGGPGGEARQERGGMGHGMTGHDRGGRHGGHGMWSNPKAAVEGHLAALKVELKITPDQETAWQAFTGKVRQQADTMIARRAEMKARHEQTKGQASAVKLSAPEQLAQRTERMKRAVAGMESMTVAVKDLYGVLTPEQKTTADKLLARGPMGGFGGGRDGRGGHRGHRGERGDRS